MRYSNRKEKKRTKGLIAILTALVLVIGLSPALSGEVSADPEGTAISSWAELEAISESGTYYLKNDITIEGYEGEWQVPDSSNIVLNLNGKTLYGTINLGGKETSADFASKLTLMDTSNGMTGKVTRDRENTGNKGGVRIDMYCEFTLNSGSITGCNGGGVTVFEKGKFVMNGGSIKANTIDSESGMRQGAGVYVKQGEFVMNGGSISENTLTATYSLAAIGAGVCLSSDSDSIFTMKGGSITKNKIIRAEGTMAADGAGVNVADRATFNMSGGLIKENETDGLGGGVYIDTNAFGDVGTFNMSGGTISDNKAQKGGGIYTEGHFNMSSGTFTNNQSTNEGAGVYMAPNSNREDRTNTEVNISGGTITANTRGSDQEDIFAYKGELSLAGAANIGTVLLNTDNNSGLTIKEPLTNTRKIKIKQTGTTNPYTFTKDSGTSGRPKAKDYIWNFEAAEAGHGIGFDGNELLLGTAATAPSNIQVTATAAEVSYGYTTRIAMNCVPTNADDSETIGYQWYQNTSNSTSGGTIIADADTGSYTIPAGLEVGTYYYYCEVISWNKTSHAMRKDLSDVAAFTVKKADASYTTAVEAKTGLLENNKKQELVTAGVSSFGEILYALGKDDTTAPTTGWSTSIPVGVNAEKYYVWYKVEGSANYNGIAPACVEVTIGSAPGSYGSIPTIPNKLQIIMDDSRATAETNTFKAAFGVDSEKLIELLGITAEEISQGVNVWVKFNDGAGTLTDAEKDLIKNGCGEYTVGQFLNISIYKRVGSGLPEGIHETKGKVKLIFEVPKELIKDRRTFGIVSAHGEKAAFVDSEFNEADGTMSLENNEYSPYAIVYKDAKEKQTTTPEEVKGLETEANTTEETTTKSPDTGDFASMSLYVVLLFAALAAGFATINRRKA